MNSVVICMAHWASTQACPFRALAHLELHACPTLLEVGMRSLDSKCISTHGRQPSKIVHSCSCGWGAHPSSLARVRHPSDSARTRRRRSWWAHTLRSATSGASASPRAPARLRLSEPCLSTPCPKSGGRGVAAPASWEVRRLALMTWHVQTWRSRQSVGKKSPSASLVACAACSSRRLANHAACSLSAGPPDGGARPTPPC